MDDYLIIVNFVGNQQITSLREGYLPHRQAATSFLNGVLQIKFKVAIKLHVMVGYEIFLA